MPIAHALSSIDVRIICFGAVSVFFSMPMLRAHHASFSGAPVHSHRLTHVHFKCIYSFKTSARIKTYCIRFARDSCNGRLDDEISTSQCSKRIWRSNALYVFAVNEIQLDISSRRFSSSLPTSHAPAFCRTQKAPSPIHLPRERANHAFYCSSFTRS